MRVYQLFSLIILTTSNLVSQSISDFTSISPGNQDQTFKLPVTHSFQYLIEHGDELTEGGTLPDNCDFTGYVAIDGSSSNGYLSINSEATPGGVTILDIQLDEIRKKWIVTRSEGIDFNLVQGTARNCSGAITPWNTVITCEETTSTDSNGDGYYDLGWAIEIDPATKQIVNQQGGLDGPDKLWALGNFKHENAIIHENNRTVYQGVDDAIGYLYKFVADVAEDLSSGKLYVYKGSKSGIGDWIEINNSTPSEQNTTLSQSAAVGATVFAGIEDVDISPIDGKVYLAVKSENRVYRFDDSDAISGLTVSNFETYVGGTSYDIETSEGTMNEPWGTGNDNLAFDNLGNLWVTQDGGDDYIWVVEIGHTQSNPKVKIFGQAPSGSEPTGIAFTPDYKYLFMSIQHPSISNFTLTQEDAFGIPRSFDKDVALVIALADNFNNPLSVDSEENTIDIFPNPASNEIVINLVGVNEIEEIHLVDHSGKKVKLDFIRNGLSLHGNTKNLSTGIYVVRALVNSEWLSKKILISR
jgi:secreted PhoX family phosphatase